MSALIGNKGSKSGLVGVPGRLDIENVNASRTGAQGSGTGVAYDGATPNFRPTAGFALGDNYSAGNAGIGWGFFDQDGLDASATTRNTTSESNFARLIAQLYGNGGGTAERWQCDLASITDTGVTLTWNEIDTNSTTCHVRILFLR